MGGTYTYHDGKKLSLEKAANEFVVRAQPEELKEAGFANVRRLSPRSAAVGSSSKDQDVMMNRARRLAPTQHAYCIAETGQEFLISDRIFVKFADSLTAVELALFIARYALVEADAYSNREYLFQLTNRTGINPVKLVVKLTEEEPLVEFAEHDLNYRAKTYQIPIPTDPAYLKQWHLHRRMRHADFDPRASSLCEDAWQILGHTGSREVVVGITDDGCKLSHRDFASPGKFAGWGYFNKNRLVTDADIDADSELMYESGANHGTSCASVIAAEINGFLTVGAAPGCRLLPIKWASDGGFLLVGASRLRRVLDYFADKVDIISNSWGLTPATIYPRFIKDRIRQLAQTGGRRERGIVFLSAAGNHNCPIQHESDQDIPFTSGWSLGSRGAPIWVKSKTSRIFKNQLVGIPGVMHVAALASTGQRSHYSNYGAGIGICAPSDNRHAYRRMKVRGLGVTTGVGGTVGITSSFGGTSSAAPLVAGIAALVISANPNLSAAEVISILKRTASKELNYEGYPRTPPTSFDPDTSWDVSPVSPFDAPDFIDINSTGGTWSPWFGHGKVDAARAVSAALGKIDF